MNTPTILKKILATKDQEVALRSKTLPLNEIKAMAHSYLNELTQDGIFLPQHLLTM